MPWKTSELVIFAEFRAGEDWLPRTRCGIIEKGYDGARVPHTATHRRPSCQCNDIQPASDGSRIVHHFRDSLSNVSDIYPPAGRCVSRFLLARHALPRLQSTMASSPTQPLHFYPAPTHQAVTRVCPSVAYTTVCYSTHTSPPFIAFRSNLSLNEPARTSCELECSSNMLARRPPSHPLPGTPISLPSLLIHIAHVCPSPSMMCVCAAHVSRPQIISGC
ncbi:hypothetical protein C8T65DRAFT_154728 [Cerioporus squamosus]|nr:hypothetical protein C8T65DRAFT_154728 [Cerioporus squamosus]